MEILLQANSLLARTTFQALGMGAVIKDIKNVEKPEKKERSA